MLHTNRGFSNDIYDVPTTSELNMNGESNQAYYDEIPAHESSGRGNYYEETTVEYSTIPDGPYEKIETPDTSNEGLVYSAVVVKDGKKTQENWIKHSKPVQ